MLILDFGDVHRITKRRFLKFFSVFLLLFLFTNVVYGVLPLRAKAVTPGYNGKIAFQYRQNTSSKWQIFIMNPDGSGQTNISNSTANDVFPAWSPDGTKITFVSDRDGNNEIYVMNAGGSGQTPLTTNSQYDGSNYPAWSPDGTKIAFMATDPNTLRDDIYVMNADGTGKTQLTHNRNPDGDSQPDWSPDGTKIAYRSDDGSRDDEINVMNADGTGVSQVTSGLKGAGFPKWSPDGTKIAFYNGYSINNQQGIYIINNDGTGQINISNSGIAHAPVAWSPDGTKMAVTANFTTSSSQIGVINADGTNLSNLTNNNALNNTSPNWQSVSLPPIPAAPTNLTISSPTQNPSLSWTTSSGATSYNIYRNNTLIDSINSSADPVTYTDFLAPEGNDTYYVTAVNSGGESAHSNSVAVLVDRTAPSITYAISPTPNTNGWVNGTPATVTFSCTDNTGGSGIASCGPQQSESADGAYALTGTAIDKAGNSSSINVTLNIDSTVPLLSNLAASPTTFVQGNSTNLSAAVSDATSGVASAEYYVGTDPGQGHGTAMTISNGTASATVSNLPAGLQSIYVRDEDNAGNWSVPLSVQVTVKLTAPTGLTAPSPTNAAPALSWNTVTGADHYDIYRDGSKVGTATTASYADAAATEGSHTYYVKAVTADNVSSDQSNSVTVLLDATPPTITYSISPAANSSGWNNTSVTATFICADNVGGSGIATCTSPVTVSTDGANQQVTGTAADKAGNTATVTATVNIDQTAPTVSNVTLATDPLAVNQTTTLSATVADNTSGVSKAEYYTGADPGQGNGTAMNLTSGTATATVGSYTTAGMHTYYVRTQDNAGNWSSPMSVTLDVYNPAGGYAAGHGSVVPNGATSNTNPSDVLPTESGNNVKAGFDFTVKYVNSTDTTPTGTSTFTWGSTCNNQHANCFVVTTDTTINPATGSLAWLIDPGDNTATFQGTASVSQGSTNLGTNYPVKVSVTGTTTTSPGHYLLQVYSVGADPATASPLYQASGDLSGGSVVLHG